LTDNGGVDLVKVKPHPPIGGLNPITGIDLEARGINQDPAEIAGLVQLTIFSSSAYGGLLKIEFH